MDEIFALRSTWRGCRDIPYRLLVVAQGGDSVTITSGAEGAVDTPEDDLAAMAAMAVV